jgi:DNA-binding LacI/PurR family transcriptional regulator
MNMKDLAKLLGVSRQTVSAVLNGKEWVSQETRERVLKAIREHNYAPNQHAVSLTGKGTRLLGVVLRDISNPFYTQIAMGIESVARASGYSILYHNTFEKHIYEVDAIRSLVSFRVSGVIISPIQLGVDLSHLEHVAALGIPLVSIDKLPNIACHSICFADQNAAYSATEYLADQGHTEIAFVKGPESAASARERLAGFLACSKNRGLTVPEEWLVDPGTTEQERHAAIYSLLKDPVSRPSAVFCFNDLLAVSVYKAAHELQIRIPEDLSVVGFDDIAIASLLGPPLTTVRTDSYQVGVEAAEMIMADLQGTGESFRDVLHTPALVVRKSVAKARARVKI